MTGSRRSKITFAFLALAAVLLLAACSPKTSVPSAVKPAASTSATSSAPATSAAAAANNAHTIVYIKDDGFHPANVTIKVGGTVVWLNNGENAHILVFDSGLNSGKILPSKSAAHKFITAGTYPYHDQVTASLIGVITVK